MIALKITKEQLEMIQKMFKETNESPSNWCDEFIFEKYELEVAIDGNRAWVKVNKKEKIISVSFEHYGMRKFVFRFGIDRIEDERIILSNVCEGPLLKNLSEDKTKSVDECVTYMQKFAVGYIGLIYIIETYIMSKQKDRKVKYVEIDETEKKQNESNVKKRKHIKKREDKPVVIDFNDIISGRIIQGHKHEIRCAKWPVRGHYRHYKNGRVIFIKEFEKGRDRNKGKNVDKTYVL